MSDLTRAKAPLIFCTVLIYHKARSHRNGMGIGMGFYKQKTAKAKTGVRCFQGYFIVYPKVNRANTPNWWLTLLYTISHLESFSHVYWFFNILKYLMFSSNYQSRLEHPYPCKGALLSPLHEKIKEMGLFILTTIICHSINCLVSTLL